MIGGTPPPDPEPVRPGADQVKIRMAGIGGTGVVTAAQILATAAMFDGWEVSGLDQTGLSQKAGPVVSDVVLVRGGDGAGSGASNLVGAGQADLLLGFDGMAAAADGPIAAADPDRTAVIVSAQRTPTGRMVVQPDLAYPVAEIEGRLDAVAAGGGRVVDASSLARTLAGSAAGANVLMLGVAVQSGHIPVSPVAIEAAIDLNGVAVEANRAAFTWGRRWTADPRGTEARAAELGRSGGVGGPRVTAPDLPVDLAARAAALGPPTRPDAEPEVETGAGSLVELVELLAADLVGFGDAAQADRFLGVVERVAAAEGDAAPGSTALTEAVARSLHKLTAYKDEYEVARLLLLPEARDEARAVVGGPGRHPKITWHLHPPMLRALGFDRKVGLGRWGEPALRALRAGKRLRGTRWDPFGRTELRRIERELPDQFRVAVDRLLAGLSAANHDEAVAIATLPDRVRGYEDLKLRRVAEYRAELERRLSAYG